MKGKKTGGRRPGSTNKRTAEVKDALLKAFDELGGVEALVKWGKQARNRTEFYKLWAKLLPTEIKNPDGETFRVEVVEEIVSADNSQDNPPVPPAS